MPQTQTELDFSVLYGTLFTIDNAREYLIASGAMFSEHGHKYIVNKCKEAENALNTVYNALMRGATKNLNDIEKKVIMDALEQHKTLVYRFFLLDEQDQTRVAGLINKILKEKAA